MKSFLNNNTSKTTKSIVFHIPGIYCLNSKYLQAYKIKCKQEKYFLPQEFSMKYNQNLLHKFWNEVLFYPVLPENGKVWNSFVQGK